ncbi:ribonuclease H-like domain-containing protein [Tanacetum coccineum]|uniref:Ribonuclease H-like domain-containing protein n=1 Tax=Tanacetum coccineum TaxID=301880 RepID=A0ABQ4Y2E2_9ASTR
MGLTRLARVLLLLDIENVTLNEYLEYEVGKERRFYGGMFDPKEDIEIEKYHGLPPLHPCFQYAQLYTKDGLVSSNESDKVDNCWEIDCKRLNTGSITVKSVVIVSSGSTKLILANSNSYLRDILGDILGKDSDDEESYHENASDTGAAPKQQQQMEHYLEYIDNEVWKIWEAIRTRFGGNTNSKKMQKAIFKQQFEAFKISSTEGLEKGYDRFQQLPSQLEAHGAKVSTEDANHKFLRSLPAAWSNLAMTMRTKPEVDTLSIDDLYNNLRVFEQEIQGASKTSSSAQNVAFVSQSKSSTNKVKSGFTGAYSTCIPSTSSTNIPEKEVPAGFADEIAMIAIRMKKFYKKTGRRVCVDGKTHVGFDKKKLECFNCHNTGHFARECTAKGTHDGKKKRDSFYQHQEAGKQEKNQMGLLIMDDGIVNWGEHTAVEETNHALMAISSSNEVTLCSKTCIDSYNTLKLLCDEQMNQLGDQEAQILAYSQAVKKLEAQLVTFQKQQLSLNEKLTFQANEIYEKDEKLKRYRRIGMKAVKEKEQLQKTLDTWKDSSKNL